MTRRNLIDDDRLMSEASEWLSRLDHGRASDAVRDRFTQWVLRSAHHIEEFLRASRICASIDTLPDLPSVEELVRAAREDKSWVNVVELNAFRRALGLGTLTEYPVRRRVGLAVAASVVLLTLGISVGWFTLGRNVDRTHLMTQIGEQLSVTLHDGSTVHANTNSELSVVLSHRKRLASQTRGEVRFTVRKDLTRPFIVTTPQAVVRVLGTTFNVNIESGRTFVTVIEGHVTVAGRGKGSQITQGDVVVLHAGQQVAVTEIGHILRDSGPPLRRAVEWPRHLIYFHNATMAEVVAQFNRYHRQAMRIADPALADHQVDGTFDAFDRQSLLDYLKRYHGVNADGDASEGDLVLRRRK